MYRELLLSLVVCILSTGLPEALEDETRLVPGHITDAHRLQKRQQGVCPGIYFLAEPPASLRCNPDPRRTLRLNCTFLSGELRPGINQVPLNIAWFFSSDGRVGQLVQVSQFVARVDYSSFESILAVLNALQGAYFCSVILPTNNLILDSNPLIIDNRTLDDFCLPQEPPTLQPPQPRCAVRGATIDPAVPLVPRTVIAVTNTINLGMGVVAPTPTFTLAFQPTMDLPVVTPAAVVQETPTPAPNNIGIGVVVGIVVGILGTVLLLGLVVGAICLVKKRERNQLGRKKKSTVRLDQSLFNQRIQEPLINQQPPPNRPPPIRPPELNQVDGGGTQHQEEIEMHAYTHPNCSPQPYEVSNTMRYTREPQVKPKTKLSRSMSAPHEVEEEEIDQQSELGQQTRQESTYYSRPKFPVANGRRTSSTSTHIYVGSKSESGIYISAEQLRAFKPHSKKSVKIATAELMLGDTDSTTQIIPEGSESEDTEYSYEEEEEEGEWEEEGEEEEWEEEEDEEEEEMEDEEGGGGTDEYRENLSKWVGSKSPATGQSKDSTQQPYYMNTSHTPYYHLDKTEETELYINSPRPTLYLNVPASAHKLGSTKSAPSGSAKKKRKKTWRNRSTPLVSVREQQEYTGLTHTTQNYTSVYSTPSEC